jgi:hypothetical protein
MSVMTPFKARLIEAALGGAVGAGAGGYVGLKTFQTKDPQYWIQGDQIYSRELEPREEKDRIKRLASAALAGAGGLASLSLGASAIRRGFLRAQDLKHGRQAFKTLMSQSMDGAIAGERSSLASKNRALKAAKVRMSSHGGDPIEYLREFKAQDVGGKSRGVSATKDLLEKLQRMRNSQAFNVDKYISDAQSERNIQPWGGFRRVKVERGGIVHEMPLPVTAEGQMARVIGPENLNWDDKGNLKGPTPAFWKNRVR